jgi:cytoskeletal protein RodZ
MDVGSQLRRAREARGLSIETLAAGTRIQPRVLDGLERNDLSVIPPRPYARGFVAAYAREVGLDPAQTVRDYFAQFEDPVPAISDKRDDLPASSPQRPVFALAAGVALALTVLLVLWRPEASAPAVDDVVGTTGTSAPAVSPAADRTAPAAPVPAAGSSPAATREEIVAVLQAERAAWISATADGERVLYQVVQPGTIETVRARRELAIRVGDAGAVHLSVNGAPAAPMGRSGQVRTVTLTPSSAR